MIDCFPNNDIQKRFLLGKSGKKELLAIGLNPSTADESNLTQPQEIFKLLQTIMIVMVGG